MVGCAKFDCLIKFNNEFCDISINNRKVVVKDGKAVKKERKLTEYNIYMKNNFHRIKTIYPELKPTEIMRMVAKEWQNEKNIPKLCISLLNLFSEEELFMMLEDPEQKNEINKIIYGSMYV